MYLPKICCYLTSNIRTSEHYTSLPPASPCAFLVSHFVCKCYKSHNKYVFALNSQVSFTQILKMRSAFYMYPYIYYSPYCLSLCLDHVTTIIPFLLPEELAGTCLIVQKPSCPILSTLVFLENGFVASLFRNLFLINNSWWMVSFNWFQRFKEVVLVFSCSWISGKKAAVILSGFFWV